MVYHHISADMKQRALQLIELGWGTNEIVVSAKNMGDRRATANYAIKTVVMFNAMGVWIDKVEASEMGLGGRPRRFGTMGGSSSDDGAAVVGLRFLAGSFVTALFSAFFFVLGNASSSSPSVEASSQALFVGLTFEPLAAGCFHTGSVSILLARAGRRILRTFGKSGEAVHSK